jgi:ribosomal protein L17
VPETKTTEEGIEMPLPGIILGLGAALVGGGVASGAAGVKKMSDANKIIKQADMEYRENKEKLEKEEEYTTRALDALGRFKLDIWESFKRFSDAFEKIKNRPVFTHADNEQVGLTQHELAEIEHLSISAFELLGSAVISGGAGALAGLAAYGGTMALGVASTGTAISSLAGAAATKATLAALGGGSLAAGGGGIALGVKVLATSVAAPVVAVGGLLMNAKGNSSLKKAREVQDQVDEIVAVMKKSMTHLRRLKRLSIQVARELAALQEIYISQVSRLEEIVEHKTDYNLFTDEDKQVLDNTIMLVKLLSHISKQDLLKKRDGGVEELRAAEVTEELARSQEFRDQLAIAS